MDELAVAHIDAYVAEGAAHGVEKNQVAGLELVAVDDLGGRGLFIGPARQHQADGLFVGGAHEAAAIETGFGRIAAAFVGHAEETHRMHNQFRGLFADRVANLFDLVAETTDETFVGQQALHVVFGSREGNGVRGGTNQEASRQRPAKHGRELTH